MIWILAVVTYLYLDFSVIKFKLGRDSFCLEWGVNVSKLIYIGKEAVAQRCSIKKMFIEIWQNSQENTCARVSFLTKLHANKDSGTGIFLWIFQNF